MLVLPNVTGKQAQKVVENAGWKLVRQEGAHYYYRTDEFPGRIIVIPVYDDDVLPLKVLCHILDLAELNFDELVWFL